MSALSLCPIPSLSYDPGDPRGSLPILMFKELEPDWLRYNSFLSALPLRERKRRESLAASLRPAPLKAHSL